MLIKKEECDEALGVVNKCECWLCLREADVSDCVLFNEIHKEMLEVLLAKDVANGLGSDICNNCINILDQSFAFKSTCLYIEDNLTPLISSENVSKLDIFTVFGEVYKDKRELLSKDSKVCRFCLNILEKVSYTFLKDLSQSDLEMLKKVTPKVQLEAIKESIICEVCLHCFRDSLKFINMCLNALKMCDNSSWTSLKNNYAPIDNSTDNLISSELDIENSREPNDGSILNPKEIKREPDLFESSDTTCPKTHHESDEESFPTLKCNVCDFATEDEDFLAIHMSVHNNSKVKLENSDECTFQSESKPKLTKHPVKENLYKCQLCQFSTKRKNGLIKHQNVHKKPDKPELYKCRLCQFSTKHKRNLVAHRIAHEKPEEAQLYKCQLCQFSARNKKIIVKHQMMTHEDSYEGKLYKCQLCQYRTDRKNCLVQHQIVHEKPDETKLYKCKLCQYSTKNKRCLVNHQIVHQNPDNANLYKCHLCSFSTKYKNSVAKHQIVHKESDEVKLYKCQLCEFSTKYKQVLVKHQIVHEKPEEVKLYKCQLCEFSTKYKQVLERHQIVHENPDEANLYKCQLCQFRTKYKRNLKGHQIMHKKPEEIKLYKCQMCQFSTKFKYGLTKHHRVHNKPDKTSFTSDGSGNSVADINAT